VVVTEAVAPQFLELERHGEPRVLFDRTGTIRALPLDHASLAARRAQRVVQLQGAIPVYRMLVEKELVRGHPLEALGFYQAYGTALRQKSDDLGAELTRQLELVSALLPAGPPSR